MMNLKFTEKPLVFAKVMLVAIKEWLPTFNCYMHNNGVSITPHLGFQWHKYQGATSKGCVKAQIHFGWIMGSCQLVWKHNAH